MARPSKAGETVTAKRVPSVAVRNRLKQPFGTPNVQIPLRTPDIIVRTVDANLRSGRVHEMLQKGWEFIQPEDLKGAPADFGFSVQDGRIVRGERGHEVLMKMHRADYDAIQFRKAAINTANLGGKRGKAALLEDVARETGARGDEAASYLANRVSVTDTRESVPLEDDGA